MIAPIKAVHLGVILSMRYPTTGPIRDIKIRLVVKAPEMVAAFQPKSVISRGWSLAMDHIPMVPNMIKMPELKTTW
jgi:hypothetical protein